MNEKPVPRPKVVLTHWVHPEVTALLGISCNVVMPPDRDGGMSRKSLLLEHADAEALMAFMTDWVDEAMLAKMPRLRIVAGALKGADSLNPGACEKRGVWVTVVPDLLTVPTAELTLGLMLGLARYVAPADAFVRSGEFTGWRSRFFGTLLGGSTAGLIGMGAIGKAIASRLQAMQMNVQYFDSRPLPEAEARALGISFLPLEHLAASSDFVVLALPLRPETYHLVNAALLAKMKPGCLLINPARGSLVDEDAVAQALASGQLGGYAADVFAFEDWAQPGRPAWIHPGLIAHKDRTLFTPHLGSAVDAVRREIGLQASRSILQALAGQIPNGAVNSPTRFR